MCQKTLSHPCTHFYRLFADLSHDFEHYIHFGRGLANNPHITTTKGAFRKSTYFFLGGRCWEWMYGNLINPCKSWDDWKCSALLQEDHWFLWMRGTSGDPGSVPSNTNLLHNASLSPQSTHPNLFDLIFFFFKQSLWTIDWVSDRQDALRCTNVTRSFLAEWMCFFNGNN